ncbi:MAG: tetratricopeptide repeat protein [Bacteroidia bacterium]
MLYRFVLLYSLALIFVACSPSSEIPSTDLLAVQQWTEQAQLAMQDGEAEKADSLLMLAVESLESIYDKDSTSSSLPNKLGELNYQLRNFNSSVAWYARAIQQDSTNMTATYQLARGAVQIGEIKLAQIMFQQAISLDESDTLSRRVVQELKLIGEETYGHGNQLYAKGDTQSGNTYRIFGVSLLMTAFDLDSTRQDLAQRIVDYCYEIGDKESADQYSRWTFSQESVVGSE